MSLGLSAIFVYGTLKQGGVREKCWPHRPLSIEAATVGCALYNLGLYPGLTARNYLVAGELWQFAESDMPATLEKLDEVEGYSGAADDWYRRTVIDCQTSAGDQRAWTYFYARTNALRDSQRIKPDARGICHWLNPEP